MLGRVQPAHFPAVFGPDGDQPLDAGVVRERLRRARRRRGRAPPATRRSPEEVAAGFLEIAVLNMANAVKKISVQRGHDITRYALTCFGGAGGQHACAVADALGVDTVLVPPLAGVLSAYGIGLADATAMREQSVEAELDDDGPCPGARSCATTSPSRTRAELLDDGVPGRRHQHGHARVAPALRGHRRQPPRRPGHRRRDDRGVRRAAHRARYGFTMDKPLRRRGGVGRGGRRGRPARAAPGGRPAAPGRSGARSPTVRMFADGRWQRRPPLHRRDDLRPATPSPAPPSSPRPTPPPSSTRLAGRPPATRPPAAHPGPAAPRPDRGRARDVDPVHAGGVQQPLHVDRRADGRAPGEHRPLRQHQGAARLLLRPLRRRRQPDRQRPAHPRAPRLDGRVHQGGAAAQRRPRCAPATSTPINDPYHGGTHLPDVTVVTPVFDDRTRRAELAASWSPPAATTPRSAASPPAPCPPSAAPSHEEGVLFDNWLLVRDGAHARGARPASCSPAPPYPSRDPGHQPRRPARPDRRQREGHRRTRGAWWTQFGLDVVARLHGARAGQRRGVRTPHRRGPARRLVRATRPTTAP